MGSVIEKTVQVLKLVASQEHCTLKTLCTAMGSKKSALCQMLRSMTETGLLLKDVKGEYHTGPLFSDLAEKRENNLNRQKLIETVAVDLNAASGANVTVATIRNGKYKRLFSCCTFKVTRLTPTAPDEDNFYGNATGRVLLANAPSEVKLRIIDRLGLPSPQEWQAGSENQEALLAELEKIRRENHADLFCNGARNYYIAATVPGAAAGLIPLAIGLGLPGAQSEKKEFFLKLLFQAVKRFE